MACAGLKPDLTILIDVDLETSKQRSRARNRRARSEETRIDDESEAFHARVRAGYLELARKYPQRIVVVNGTERIGAVAEEIWAKVGARV